MLFPSPLDLLPAPWVLLPVQPLDRQYHFTLVFATSGPVDGPEGTLKPENREAAERLFPVEEFGGAFVGEADDAGDLIDVGGEAEADLAHQLNELIFVEFVRR